MTGYLHVDFRALPWRRGQPPCAAQFGHTLLHAEQAIAAVGLGRIEALAVVFDGDVNQIALQLQRDFDARAIGVARAIVDGLFAEQKQFAPSAAFRLCGE